MKAIARGGILFFIVGCFGAFGENHTPSVEILSYLSMFVGAFMHSLVFES